MVSFRCGDRSFLGPGKVLRAMRRLFTSICKKIIMGVTGLFLCSFLVAHLSGNLLLFKKDGGEAFDAYAEFMSHNELIRVMEIVLFLGLLFHIVDGIRVSIENRKKRSVRYAVDGSNENTRLASRFMAVSGVIILVFLVVHLKTFFVESRFIQTDASMYDLVVSAFQNPIYSLFYVVAMILLGVHLNHGFQSAFQSLGINHPVYTPILKRLGAVFSVVVPLGFALFPIYFYLEQFR